MLDQSGGGARGAVEGMWAGRAADLRAGKARAGAGDGRGWARAGAGIARSAWDTKVSRTGTRPQNRRVRWRNIWRLSGISRCRRGRIRRARTPSRTWSHCNRRRRCAVMAWGRMCWSRRTTGPAGSRSRRRRRSRMASLPGERHSGGKRPTTRHMPLRYRIRPPCRGRSDPPL